METAKEFQLIPNGLAYGLSATEKRAVLRHNHWLQNLDPEQLESLSQYLTLVYLDKGKTIFHQGDSLPFMAIMHAGKVEIRKEGHDGEDQVIAVIGPGHVIGEMSLIDGGSRSATAIAVENTQLFVLTEESFEAIRKGHTSLWGGLLMRSIKTVTKRLRRASGQFVDILAEHGGLGEENWQQPHKKQNKENESEVQFLMKQLGILNQHIERVSEHIHDRAATLQKTSEPEIKIDGDIYQELQRHAIYHKQSMAQHINHILRQHLKPS